MKKHYKKTLLLFLLTTTAASIFAQISSEVINTQLTTRSLNSQTTAPLTFGESAFNKGNFFYLGASSANPGTYALTKAYIQVDTTQDQNVKSVKLDPLAPEKAQVNRTTKEDAEVANPVYDQTVEYMSLKGATPVVVVNQTICHIEDSINGKSVRTNETTLKDSSGTDGEIAGIEAIPSQIFVAVKPSAGNFGDDNSGIGIVKPKDNALAPIDATTGSDGNKAVNIKADLSPTPTRIDIINDHVAMHWDGTIQRLFVGVHGGINSSDTFICGLLVGRLEDSKLILEPAIPNTVIGANEDLDKIVAFYNSSNIGNTIAIHNIKTMHTSTGKTYVIINGDIYADSGSITKTEMYALPIINKQYSDSTIGSSLIGQIADKDSTSQEDAPASASNLPTSADTATQIGGGTTPGDVETMFVAGDSVYVCCAHADQDKQGIFQSTALFDQDGLLQSWTPWQRAMGAVEPVIGGAIDLNTTNFWYLTQTTNPGDTVKATLWDYKDSSLLGNLRDKLASEFTQENAGVHQLFNFDEKTPGFSTDEFSMMVATGNQKVALIQTGKVDTQFVPTKGTDFSTNLADNVKVYNSNVIKNIGPICSADVARSATESWLFVGGYNGVAVLRQSDGAGWVDLSALTPDLDDFSFKTIGSFKHVHKIICDDTYVYILTPSALYRIEMIADKFKDDTPDSLNAEIIAQPTYANITQCNQYDSLLDFIVSSKVGILATTSGLYRTANGETIAGTTDSARKWTEVLSLSGYTLGPITHLLPKSLTKGSFNQGGNLNIVAGNMSTDLATIIRFTIANTSSSAIDDDTIQAITEKKETSSSATRDYYYRFGEFRSTFNPDGTFGYHELPKHFNRANYLKKINMAALPSSARYSELSIVLDLQSNAHNAGIITQNTASGAWIVPGDWGIRINE